MGALYVEWKSAIPISDVQLVVPGTEGVPSGLAQAVANALGHLFESPAGHTWVRASTLPAAHYAENDSRLAQDDLPAFCHPATCRATRGRSPGDPGRAHRLGDGIGRGAG